MSQQKSLTLGLMKVDMFAKLGSNPLMKSGGKSKTTSNLLPFTCRIVCVIQHLMSSREFMRS